MKYPKYMQSFNNGLGILSGFLVFMLAVLSTANTIGRYFLSAPLIWSADMCRYLLIYVIFIGAAFGFQEKSHVSVDLVTNAITQKSRGFKRVLRIIAHLLCLPFIVIVTYRGYVMMVNAFAIHRLTTAVFQVPQGILYLAIFLGGILMAVEVVYIILSLLSGEDKWLDA
jgi:TRAP-type C4-dicarboxylate transport system permease small subunit